MNLAVLHVTGHQSLFARYLLDTFGVYTANRVLILNGLEPWTAIA